MLGDVQRTLKGTQLILVLVSAVFPSHKTHTSTHPAIDHVTSNTFPEPISVGLGKLLGEVVSQLVE